MTDALRAAIIELLRAIIPALVLFGVVDWDSNQVSTAVLISGMIVGLFFLAFKKGQQASGTTNSVTASVTTSSAPIPPPAPEPPSTTTPPGRTPPTH